MPAAPRILAGVDSLTPDLPDSTSANDPLPRTLACTFAPPSSLPEDYALPPTHILSLRFESTDAPTTWSGAATRPDPEHLIVPAHQLVWSARCRRMAHLMSVSETVEWGAPPKPATSRHTTEFDPSPPSPLSVSAATNNDDPERLHLPVITFPTLLPAAALSSFPLLHAYLHTATLPHDLPASQPTCCSHDRHDDPISRTQEYEALWRMCQAFGIANSDEFYQWLKPRWQAACQATSVWDA